MGASNTNIRIKIKLFYTNIVGVELNIFTKKPKLKKKKKKGQILFSWAPDIKNYSTFGIMTIKQSSRIIVVLSLII